MDAGRAGQPGGFGEERAWGGIGESSSGSDGGYGGAALYADGEDAREACSPMGGSNSGGGGGGAGIIRLNSKNASAILPAGVIISPTDARGECTGLCSQGEVAVQ